MVRKWSIYTSHAKWHQRLENDYKSMWILDVCLLISRQLFMIICERNHIIWLSIWKGQKNLSNSARLLLCKHLFSKAACEQCFYLHYRQFFFPPLISLNAFMLRLSQCAPKKKSGNSIFKWKTGKSTFEWKSASMDFKRSPWKNGTVMKAPDWKADARRQKRQGA